MTTSQAVLTPDDVITALDIITESTDSILIEDTHSVSTHNDIMIDTSTESTIMTESPLGMNAKITPPKNRSQLKIASFRTTEGAWEDFSAACKKLGWTATDILKNAMESFTTGEYTPTVNTGIHTGVTQAEVLAMIQTELASRNYAVTSDVLTSISTSIDTALAPLQEEISEVAEFSRNLQGEIAKVKKPLAIV